MGMSDSNITLVQKRLSDLGFSVGAIDGIFGENTKNAVIDFQYSRGLDADVLLEKKHGMPYLILQIHQVTRKILVIL